MTPDLDNDPIAVLIIGGTVLAMIAVALWLYERKHDGRPYAGSTAQRRRTWRAVCLDAFDAEDARAEGREQADDHRMVGSRDGDPVRAQHDREPGRTRDGRLALTDDEVVALAAYLERTTQRRTRHPFPPAAVKVLNVAMDVIHADRAGRR